MLWINGVCYLKLTRLTFDGSGNAAVLVDQSWDGLAPNFDTGNEYSDVIFTGTAPGGVGLRGGYLGQGFAETSVLRAQFLSLGTAILLGNFNALDLWVWDTLFDHNDVAISNVPGAGNWHVYRSNFLYSGSADNQLDNTGGFSFINNYSVGTAPFILAGYSQNPATLTVQANNINSSVKYPISVSDQGPILLLDNNIGASVTSDFADAAWTLRCDTDLFSVGNRYASTAGLATCGKLTTLDDSLGMSLQFTQPSLPGTPPSSSSLGRAVFEVPPGASTSAIQSVIDAASALNGSRPVVHIPWGQYSGVSLTVPQSDMQIVGDGREVTSLYGSIRLLGPASHVIVRDLGVYGVYGSSVGDGIRVESGDQPMDRVFLDQISLGSTYNNFFYDGLTNLQVDAQAFQHTLYDNSTGTSVLVTGSGKVNIFNGTGGIGGLQYGVTGGSLVVRDDWVECVSGASEFLAASGAANVAVVGSNMAYPSGYSSPVVDLSGLSGTATLLGDTSPSRTQVSASTSGVALAIGDVSRDLNGQFLPSYVNALSFDNKAITPGEGYGSVDVPDQGTYSAAVVRAGLALTRSELPAPITDLPATATDVRMYRLRVNDFGSGIHLARSASPGFTVTASHTGSFTQGQTGAAYTVGVANSGTAASTGTVAVTDTAPAGLTVTGMSGTGWSCAQVPSCTRSDILAAGASYPAITVTVNVASSASSPLINQATVSGGGASPASAADSTTILPGDSVTPSSGSGRSQTFSFVFADPKGYAALSSVLVIVNSSLAWASGCSLLYYPASNALYLAVDAGNAWSGPAALGQSGSLQNSQCTVNAASSSASGSGDNLTVNLALSFQASFAGLQNIYMDAYDGPDSGWQLKGSWTPVPAVAMGPVSVTPGSGGGSSQTFAFLYADPKGYASLSTILAIINSSLAWASGCSLLYYPASNALYLAVDAGNAWLGPATLGQSGTLQNSQCAVNAASSSVSGIGNNLTVNLALSFQASFTGLKNIYMDAYDGPDSGWQLKGSWTPVPAVTVTMGPVSVTPGSGSGSSQTFAFLYADPKGYASLSTVLAIINSSLAWASGCSLLYYPASNALYLAADAGNAWLGPATLGQSGTLQNSQCAVNAASSSVSGSGNNLTVNLALSFQASFTGTKNIYMDAYDGPDSGWQLKGSWIP